MGYELEELKGANAVMRDGTREMILKVVNLGEGGLNFPFDVKFYDDDFDDTYTEGGICYPHFEVGRDIISIELPKKEENPFHPDNYQTSPDTGFYMHSGSGKCEFAKDGKPEYEVFEITKYADLDVLETRILADEFEKITTPDGSEVGGTFYYTIEDDNTASGWIEYRIGKGDTIHLYPKKLSKLERIEKRMAEISNAPAVRTPPIVQDILDILNEPEENN